MPTQKQQQTNTEGGPPLNKMLVEEARNTLVSDKSASSIAEPEPRVSLDSLAPNESATESFGFHVHNYVSELIRFADQKAAFIFALDAAVLGYLYRNNLRYMLLKLPATFGPIDFLFLVAIAFVALGLMCSCLAIAPSLKKTHKGPVFFGSISKFNSADAYATEILGMAKVHLIQAILKHTYDLARICNSKYRKLRLSVCFSSAGILLAIILFLVM